MAMQHWLQLSLVDGLGPITLKRLLEAAGSAEAACLATVSLLRSIEGIGPAKAQTIRQGLAEAELQTARQLELAAAAGVDVIALDDQRYPALLRMIYDPPAVLFCRGTLEPRDLNAIAIVGSRGCTFYGKEQASRFAGSLAASGFTVVSGGARGVDTAAHRGALMHPAGRTVCVLGCGIDLVYPPENAGLFDEIAQRGAILSEYPFGTQALPGNFPRRNRIVSGMSRAVLVVEADEKSGALITARTACEQDRTVFALPGRIDNRMSAGPHALIRDGATLVTSMQDLVEGLSPLPAEMDELAGGELLLFDDAANTATPETQGAQHQPLTSLKPSARPVVPVTDQQKSVLDAIEGDSTNVDAIVERTNLEAHIVLQELTLLSLKGLIRRVDGQSYCRKN